MGLRALVRHRNHAYHESVICHSNRVDIVSLEEWYCAAHGAYVTGPWPSVARALGVPNRSRACPSGGSYAVSVEDGEVVVHCSIPGHDKHSNGTAGVRSSPDDLSPWRVPRHVPPAEVHAARPSAVGLFREDAARVRQTSDYSVGVP